MKVLGLFGSPRRGGNTDLLLEEMLKGAQSQGAEIEKIFLSDLDISGCRECRSCEATGNCVVQDQMQEIYARLMEADYIILASPIFFYGVTAQAKRMIDRCQALWARKYILKKSPRGKKAITRRKGWFLSVAGSRGAKVFEGAILTVKYFFDALNVEYAGELTFRGIDAKEAIKKHPSALKEAFEAGQRLVASWEFSGANKNITKGIAANKGCQDKWRRKINLCLSNTRGNLPLCSGSLENQNYQGPLASK